MKVTDDDGHEQGAPATSAADETRLTRRPLVWLVGLALVVALVVICAAFLPRWWAQRIGDQVGGSMATGIVLGLFYGFVFVVLPLFLLRFVLRRRRRWKTIAWSLLGAVLLAAPNLVTLSIVVGTGNAAHAGERILDVEGPGFRYSTLVGAVAAVAAWLAAEYLLASRRRTRRRLARLDEQLRDRTAAEAPPTQ